MRKLSVFFFVFTCLINPLYSADTKQVHPEIFKVGVFLYNIFDLNFSQKEFSCNIWIWFVHSGKYQYPQRMFEVTNAKTVTISNEDNQKLSDGRILSIAKITPKIIENWNVANYPFDYHKLSIEIEVSGYGGDKIRYELDCENSSLTGKGVTDSLSGWKIVAYDIPRSAVTYSSTFGNPEERYENFSRVTPSIYIKRNWVFEFFRVFSILYVAIFFAFMSLLGGTENTESRVNFIAIATGAIVVNKFVVDSVLPVSGGFSLYSLIELITLCSICVIAGITIFPIHFKLFSFLKSKKLRFYILIFASVSYIVTNLIFILSAYYEYKNAFKDVPQRCQNKQQFKNAKVVVLED